METEDSHAGTILLKYAAKPSFRFVHTPIMLGAPWKLLREQFALLVMTDPMIPHVGALYES